MYFSKFLQSGSGPKSHHFCFMLGTSTHSTLKNSHVTTIVEMVDLRHKNKGRIIV